jgi:2,4-dienoyl-CoA reductase-like NADH-dependent reductase (Old Yellow Enzyme family)
MVMASMTRGRARNAELAPTELHVEYYRQRAAAGLILTEGTWISPRAIGFINVPGLFTERQVEGWHAATTYLLPEFLNSALNIREDAYGGSAEGRTRIVLEVLDALIAVWGPDDFARSCRSQPRPRRPTTRADRRDMSTTPPPPEHADQKRRQPWK